MSKIRVRFIPKDPTFDLNINTDIEIDENLNRDGLSRALNDALSLDPYVLLDFKIEGHFLRQSLAQACKLYHLNANENVLAIEYFPAFQPPQPSDEANMEDWVSCLRYHNGTLFASLYNGTIVCPGKTFEMSHLLMQDPCPSGNDSKNIPLISSDPTPIKSFAFLGDSKAVCGDIEGYISIFDFETYNEEQTKESRFPLHDDVVNSIATFDQFQSVFLSGCANGEMKIWNISGECLHTYEGHSASVQQILWPNEKNAISVSLDKTVIKWDLNTHTRVDAIHCETPIICAATRGDLVLTGHSDRSISLRDFRTQERTTSIRDFISHKSWVSALQWVSDEIFVSGGYDGSVKMWNMGTEVPLSTISQHDEKVFSIAVSPDDKEISFGGSQKIIRKYTFQ